MMILFVCHANLNRSPRAAEVFRFIANEKKLDVEIMSAGTQAFPIFNSENSKKAFGVEKTTQLTNEMLEKADYVVSMDNDVSQEIKEDFQIVPQKMITLGIEDNFSLRKNNLHNLYGILDQKLRPLAEEVSLSQRKRPNKEIL